MCAVSFVLTLTSARNWMRCRTSVVRNARISRIARVEKVVGKPGRPWKTNRWSDAAVEARTFVVRTSAFELPLSQDGAGWPVLGHRS